jgi:hypothetical protein
MLIVVGEVLGWLYGAFGKSCGPVVPHYIILGRHSLLDKEWGISVKSSKNDIYENEVIYADKTEIPWCRSERYRIPASSGS